MTVETEVANLTTAVDGLTSAVNVSKATLDASVADAEAAQTGAQSARDTANLHKLAAEAAATSATNTAAALTGFDLEAIAASKAVTAVDVFVYDTSKDSDGGAWRKRTQGTSWYNETLNTATRGSRREFPAVAVIVAEATKVTIYDGDDPALPMWMVFLGNSVARMIYVNGGSYVPTSVVMKNGHLAIGNSLRGVIDISFAADTALIYRDNTAATVSGYRSGGIVSRNVADVNLWDGTDPLGVIINDAVNDVAMTVLPDAPIDPATGLPVPTIAVATDGGVSVIKDDGTVVDITYSIYGQAYFVYFRTDGALVFNNGNNFGNANWTHVFHNVPQFDIADGFGYKKESADEFYSTNSATYVADLAYLDATSSSPDAMANNVWGKPNGLSFLLPYKPVPSKGMVAYSTSTYNTGWMNGDIKGAFLSDTDDTDLVGSGELVTNGTFDTDTTGWTAGVNTTLSIDTGRLKITSTADAVSSAYQTFTTVVGQKYLVRTTGLEATSTSSNARTYVGTSLGGTQYGNILGVGDTEQTLVFTATTTTAYIQLNQNTTTSGLYMLFDNVSVKAVDADRSVNNNGLIVNGTVTKNPVATGADLVAYSGFSASNYLEQPYNSDLDFGTGDYCVMGWVKATDDNAFLWQRDDSASAGKFFQCNIGSGTITVRDSGGISTVSVDVGDDVWHLVCQVRRSGNLHLYIDGVDQGSVASANNLDNATATFSVGVNAASGGSAALNLGGLALLRISATAPSPEQIAKIYNDEKVLFQENVQATLYGTSDAVTALAHDDATNLLHVGTSAGRSVFQGLRRVSNTTNAVGTAISASNGLVVEE